jgi:hypothetical protein
MDAASFRATTSGDVPPAGLASALQVLWWADKGDWERAHSIAQDDESADGAWVHAYLHRVEGDIGNAGYWYRRAGKPVCLTSLEAEWNAMAAELLQR